VLPPGVPQYFVTLRGRKPQGSDLLYRPAILGSARIRFFDKTAGVDLTEDKAFTTALSDAPVPVDWDSASDAGIRDSDLEKSPAEGARYESIPPVASKPASYDAWSKAFLDWLVRTEKRGILRSPSTGEVSRPDESERDFRIRLQQAGREQRDSGKEILEKKYAPKIAALNDRIRRAQQSVDRESGQVQAQTLQTAISVGATILGSLFGRKTFSAGTIGRATTAVRGVERTVKESQDVGRAKESVEALQAQLAELETALQEELRAQEAKSDPLTETLATVTIRPARKDVAVRLIALVWEPHWRDAGGALTPASS
jgi:G:T/U-mismatch repair DNA glycosylase